VARIHSRGGGLDGVLDWVINVENHLIDVTHLGSPLFVHSYDPTITLDLAVMDSRVVHRIAERCAEQYGHYVSVDATRYGGYRVSGILITQAEAELIARHHRNPIEVLLGPAHAYVAAVPIDMKEFL
jgi:hypothetical protein